MTPDPGRSIVEEAFAADGPVFDGPKAKGRRAYDQTFWWVRFIKEVGFPIAVVAWGMKMLIPEMQAQTAALNRNTATLAALVCKVDPPSCLRAATGGTP